MDDVSPTGSSGRPSFVLRPSSESPPLAGVRVLDFTQYAAGPLAAKFLADYGAEVILIESEAYITTGGGSRQKGPPGLAPVNTAYFHNKMNSNKLSTTIDLTQPSGGEIVKRLIGVSDVLIANLRPHVLEQWGLSYEAVRELRPEIIYLTMPTMGAGGPRSFYGGFSWGIQAMAGLNAISGYADRPPASPTPYSHPDVSCNPLHAMVAIMAALRHRRRTGEGQLIELSQYESTICWTGPAVLQYTANGTLVEPSENRHPQAAPHDVYRCQGEDNWCAIAVFDDRQWRALCGAIGRPELVDHPSYVAAAARKEHESDFPAILEPWTSQRSELEVMHSLQAVGVPAAAVSSLEHVLRRDPQLKHREVWTEVQHPELGTALAEDWAFRFASIKRVPPRRAPLLGEHNDYVFLELLRMEEDEVNQGIVEGVLR